MPNHTPPPTACSGGCSGGRSGGRILADQLRLHGVDHAFCVPGESYLALLDALADHQDAIALTVCRQEGGAAYMADAYGKLTGRPGLCLVTRGPGASNAMVGVHLAQQDSTPMILLVGQVARSMRHREAFQEVDLRGMFGTIAKWVADIDDAARIPEMIAHAFHTATAGRPGPVVLGLPEDMLRSVAEVADARPWQPARPHPAPRDVAAVRALLAAAHRPFVIAGGGPWSARAKADLESFATANRLPVGVSFRCQDYVDNTLPIYAGDVGIGINPALAKRIADSDLLIVVGPRLGEMTTGGYTLIDLPTPRQPLVHVHADAEELGRVYTPTLAINAAPEGFLAQLAALPAVDGSRWADWTAAAHADYQTWNTPAPSEGALDLGAVIKHLRSALPPDAILTNGAGNYAIWHHRFNQWTTWRTQLAPTNGTMGYGTPAAVAAARLHPGRTVVALAGDGCFLMNGQEFATAVHYALPIIVIVINNGMYGTIRMHQERAYPGRVHGTTLTNPDFAALARAYGAFGAVVERTEDFKGAFAEARACGGPALLELRVDPDVITPTTTLRALRRQG